MRDKNTQPDLKVALSIKGNQVKLGTDAPKHLPVVPEELLEGAAD